MSNKPTTQTALVLPSLRAPFVLDRTYPIPTPSKGEVRLKIRSVGLNPGDWKIQSGAFDRLLDGRLPAVAAGFDIAGEIDEVGHGVSSFSVGDRVFVGGTLLENEKTGYQQYTLALASTVTRIPDGFSYDDVVTIPSGLITAYVGLYNQPPHGLGFIPPTSSSAIGKYRDSPLLVIGGSTVVGQHVIQLAKYSGFNPIFTTASLLHKDALLALGATHVISRDLAINDIQGAITQSSDGELTALPYIFDTVSTLDCQRLGIQLLSPNGHLITVLDNKLPQEEIVDGKKITRMSGLLRKPENVELLEKLLGKQLEGFLRDGVLKPLRVEVIPGGLLGIDSGLKRLKLGQVSRLKLAVHPWETPDA